MADERGELEWVTLSAANDVHADLERTIYAALRDERPDPKIFVEPAAHDERLKLVQRLQDEVRVRILLVSRYNRTIVDRWLTYPVALGRAKIAYAAAVSLEEHVALAPPLGS